MLLLLIHETMWNNSCLCRTNFMQIFLLLNVTKNLTNCLLVTKQLILKQFYSPSMVCGDHFKNSGQLFSRFLTTDTCQCFRSSQTVLISISAYLKPSKDMHMRQIVPSISCFCSYFPEFETEYDVCLTLHDDKEKTIYK
jgi:hypothetical protein